MFDATALNSPFLEDAYLSVIALKKGKAENKVRIFFAKKFKEYKQKNMSNMNEAELWQYCRRNKEAIINAYENLAV